MWHLIFEYIHLWDLPRFSTLSEIIWFDLTLLSNLCSSLLPEVKLEQTKFPALTQFSRDIGAGENFPEDFPARWNTSQIDILCPVFQFHSNHSFSSFYPPPSLMGTVLPSQGCSQHHGTLSEHHRCCVIFHLKWSSLSNHHPPHIMTSLLKLLLLFLLQKLVYLLAEENLPTVIAVRQQSFAPSGQKLSFRQNFVYLF